MNDIAKLFIEKPYLAWYVKDTGRLSRESAVEHILNYGNWEDYLRVEKSIGIGNVKQIFDTLKGKKRANLRIKTISFFTRYFQRYA